MAEHTLAPLNDTPDAPSDAYLPVAMGAQGNGEFDGLSMPSLASRPTGPDLTIYVHALRRHWLLALGIGLLCAIILGPIVYVVIGDKYTAFSNLIISMQENAVIFKDTQGAFDRDRFEIFKTTQVAKMTSRPVLATALNNPEVSRLPFVREERDSIDWLERRLSVGVSPRSELMTVSLTRDDPKEAQLLVKAVVAAYISEVVNAESVRKQQKLNELEKLYSERDQDLRKKHETLKGMVGDGGSIGADVVTTRQRLAIEELQIYRNQQATAQGLIGSLRSDVAGFKALLKNVDNADVPQAELDQMVQNDPMAKEIAAVLAMRQGAQTNMRGAMKTGAKSAWAEQYGTDVSRIQEQYDARVAAIHAKARQKRKQAIESEILQAENKLKSLAQQQSSANSKIKAMTSTVSKIGETSVGIDMLRSDLSNLGIVKSQIISEIEKLKVEINQAPRITVWQEAELPRAPSNTLIRIAASCFCMMIGMCCPAALLVLWDIRVRRINTTADVSQGLRLPVIGSVPRIPARIIRQLGSPSPRHRAWHLRLTESVDGIAARLLHKADTEQCRVIMVSSATGGEGKTTLATQLALSLARTGRQTVLVDFDLRRPSFDEVFGVPLSPGISELLRHEHGVADLVHPNVNDNLSVVTAGRWNRQSLAALSNGAAAAMFKQLRESFEFIVVDTSPILPIADARFVSKFVDTVVLSVFRDVSEAPKIQAACDILAAFGVRSVDAVVTGSGGDVYGEHTGYESTVSA